MTDYAVTGVSGHLGRLAVEHLLDGGTDPTRVVAMVRDPDSISDLAERGVMVRVADYTDPASLAAALVDVRRLLFVSSSVPGQRVAQHHNVIDAAVGAGVERVLYTSIINADHSTNPLAPEHQQTERELSESGLAHTFLRNSWYTENYTASLAQYLQSGQILGAGGSGRISAATRSDYAAAAAAALLADDGASRIYELGGPGFDLAELAHVVTEVSGTEVTYRDLTVEDYTAALEHNGLDAGTAGFVAAIDASIARGELETTSTDLTDLLGRAPTTLAETVRAALG